METRWLYTTSENFPALREAAKETCVIPMGCVEKHGLHLPLGTDIITISRRAYLASQLEPVCVFPDFTFGDIPTNSPNRPEGTIMMPVDLEMAMLEHFCEQIASKGFKKIIVYNGHGGNGSWLATFLRKLADKPRDYVVMVVNSLVRAPKDLATILLKEGSGSIPELTKEDEELIIKYYEMSMQCGHACFTETARVMGICPETVNLDLLGIESGLSTHLADKYADMGIKLCDGGWNINYPNAFHGHDPIGCNERIGKATIRLEAEKAAKVFKFVKDDEDLLKWQRADWNLEG